MTAFVTGAVAASLAIGALLWFAAPVAGWVPATAMFMVPAVSVMVAAVGVPWRRKAHFASAAFAVYVLLGLASKGLGLQAAAVDYGDDPVKVVLTLLYHAIAIGFPLAALVVFVGPRPGVLWSAAGRDLPKAAGRRRR